MELVAGELEEQAVAVGEPETFKRIGWRVPDLSGRRIKNERQGEKCEEQECLAIHGRHSTEMRGKKKALSGLPHEVALCLSGNERANSVECF